MRGEEAERPSWERAGSKLVAKQHQLCTHQVDARQLFAVFSVAVCRLNFQLLSRRRWQHLHRTHPAAAVLRLSVPSHASDAVTAASLHCPLYIAGAMPATRSSPRKASSAKPSPTTTTPHKLICTTPSDRRLYLITHPDLAHHPIDHFTSITLQHPKHHTPARYLTIHQHVLECQTLRTPPHARSAFIDDHVQRAATLHLATPIDPLLLALPILTAKRQDTAERDGYFLSYQALFAGEEARFPVRLWDGGGRAFGALRHVCDVRDGWDEPVYRLNTAMTVAYLAAKVDRLVPLLPTLPSTAAACVGSSPRLLAVGLLSEYLEAVWLERLCEAVGVEVGDVLRKGKVEGGKGAKAAAVDDGRVEVVGADGLTERIGVKKVEKEKKKVVSAAVKQMQKSASGTKAISSFFGKK